MIIDTLIIITGLTGIGKTTLQKRLVDCFRFHRFITTTTRKQRTYENDEVDYHFVNENHFLQSSSEYLLQNKIFDCWYGITHDEYKLACLSKMPVVLVAVITDRQKFQQFAEEIFVVNLSIREVDAFLQERKSVLDRIHDRASAKIPNDYYNSCSKSSINIVIDGLDENEVFDQVADWLRQQDVICDLDVNLQ